MPPKRQTAARQTVAALRQTANAINGQVRSGEHLSAARQAGDAAGMRQAGYDLQAANAKLRH